jgi:hypothetical protein
MGLAVLIFKISRPKIAEINEARRILIFEAVITAGLLKARLAINMLIVKPIPPSKEIPAIYFQFNPSDRLANLNLTAKYDTTKIPRNLPTIKPNIIPREFFVTRLSTILFGKLIAVFAKANMGRIIKATG